MTIDSVGEYVQLMKRADVYHERAQWQEKLRTLQVALTICDHDGFPEREHRTQQVLYEMGGIRRRFGQYDAAEELLQRALDDFKHASPVMRAKVLGELGVVQRHSNRFEQALSTFTDQYQLAYNVALDAEAELCRAIGNEGVSAYNLYQQTGSRDSALLVRAFVLLGERVERATIFHARLIKEVPDHRYVPLSRSWQTIGLDRMTLCHIAKGDTSTAVEIAKRSQSLQKSDEPTMKAISKFFYGNALWHHGSRDSALLQWSAPQGICTPAIALCKEPTAEHTAFLKLMVEAGVEIDSYDEQGFSALDYAVLSDNADAREMIDVLLNALRTKLRRTYEGSMANLTEVAIVENIEMDVGMRTRQSQLRKAYRSLLQEHIRPQLNRSERDRISTLRNIYADLLVKEDGLRSMFDGLQFVRYDDFVKRGHLPVSFEQPTTTYATHHAKYPGIDDLYLIFFSYRWIGKTSVPSVEGPDDDHNTQYNRMKQAIDAFIKKHHALDTSKIALWLDSACINQEHAQQRERGIDALPLFVTQCDALISLVDETYYERAWCSVEVVLMQELRDSYHIHEWWEHVLHSPETDRIQGTLREGSSRNLDVTQLKLTKEKLDRPKIDFLMRQSKLLGKDRF